MAFEPRDKKPSILKRDENGQIADRDDAKRVTENLVRKLLTEERAHDKDQSFHRVTTGKRDIVVFLMPMIRNSVNGKLVLGDDASRGFIKFDERDMYSYRPYDFVNVEFPARNLPGKKEYIGKGLMSGFSVVVKWMMKMGVIQG